MNIRLKIFLIIACILFIYFLLYKVSKKKYDFRYCLPWIVISTVLIIVTIFDKLLLPIKNLFGFEELSNMIFLIGFGCVIFILISLISKLTLLSNKVVSLTQEVAILKKELNNEKNNK